MHITIVANGDLPLAQREAVAAVLASADMVLAADGGLHHCADLGVWPAVLIGDLDSVSADIVKQAEAQGTIIDRHPADKEATDLELALERATSEGATQVTVVAPFGGRLDHELATIGLLAASRWSPVSMAATDGRRQLWVVESQLTLSLAVGTTVSLVPIHGDVEGVTTAGMRWPLRDEPLPAGTSRGVSNVVADPTCQISITSGRLLVICDHQTE